MPRLKVADCDANCCTLCTSTDCLWCFLLLVVFSIAPVFEPRSLWFFLVEADNFKGCTDRCLVHQLYCPGHNIGYISESKVVVLQILL